LRGAVADQRVDVYGLGVVLYELLTGHLPHEGLTPYDVAARALTEAPRSPAEYNPALWPALADVVLCAVASDVNERYPDMPSLVEALRWALLARGSSAYTSARLTRLIDAPRHEMDQPLSDPAGDIWRDSWGPSGLLSGVTVGAAWRRATKNLRQRGVWGLARVVTAVLALALLMLGAFGAGHALAALFAPHTQSTGLITSTTPTSSPPIVGSMTTPTVTQSGSGTPTVAATLAPTPTRAPASTATPLRTPTIVVGASSLRFQPYNQNKNCVATQKLSNISAVDAKWSWSNAPAANWHYNTAGFSSPWVGFPPTLTMTTPANSSVYVYLEVPYDSTPTGGACTKLSTVATITVTGGDGTTFSVSY
jgi:serine/threonine protein kinase